MLNSLFKAIYTTLTTAMLLCVASGTEPCCQSHADQKPEWTTAVSWPALPSVEGCRWYFPATTQVIFTSLERAIVAAHATCFRDGRASWDPEIKAHSADLLVLINARKGDILNQIVLRDASDRHDRSLEMQLVALSGGKFLLRSDFSLRLFDQDLKELRTRILSCTEEQWEHWSAKASTNGGAVLLRHWGYGENNKSLSEDYWISRETLDDLLVDYTQPYGSTTFVVDDDNVYFTPKPEHGSWGANPPVAIRKKGQTRYYLLCKSCSGNAEVASDVGLVFINHQAHANFLLADRSGDIAFQGLYGKPIDSIYSATVAMNSNRFAFLFGHGSTGLLSKDSENDGIIVFDADEMKPLLYIKQKLYPRRQGSWESWTPSQLALAPDGRQLLVLNDEVLKAFNVP